MKKTFLKTVVLLVITLFSISCSNEGPAGPTGATGASGTNGTNGINGNANVVGMAPFSTTSSNWASSFGGVIWTANLTSASSITQSIVDKGIVNVFRYYTSNGNAQWSPLPDTNTNINITYSYGLGYITFYAQSTNAVAIPNPGAITFRYVVVSPTNKIANRKTN